MDKKLAFVSKNMALQTYELFMYHDLSVVPIIFEGCVDQRLETHPDLFLHTADLETGKTLFCTAAHESFFKSIIDQNNIQADVVPIKETLGPTYPMDVLFNIAAYGKTIICNRKTASQTIIKHYEEKGSKIIHVEQGYTKCSTLLLNEDALITEDPGIGKVAQESGMDVLLIEKGHVDLLGFDYGFIGGATGILPGRVVFFYGSINKHPDFLRMGAFIESKGYLMKWIDEIPLTDVGSILTI